MLSYDVIDVNCYLNLPKLGGNTIKTVQMLSDDRNLAWGISLTFGTQLLYHIINNQRFRHFSDVTNS